MLNKLLERCYVMSEELPSRGMLNKGQVVFRYEYLVIGATNLQQLRKAGFIPNRNYGNYGIRKPDRRVWQDIWVATGKSPEKCLYNVVELLIFKFLSDLEVLKEPANFAFLFSLYNKTSNNDVLDYYAKVCRPKIIELFPKGDDGTTVINGTIFVENDRSVFQMATLFRNSIKKFMVLIEV
jgi:hypothetical protein